MEKREGKRGLWKPEEDLVLRSYVEAFGEANWADISRRSGLKRGGKSCRLRWKNYLRPNIKRGGMSPQEQDLIIRLHNLLGNRWSLIAGRLPGRTDNEVKNYWNTHLNKKSQQCSKPKADESGAKPHDTEHKHCVPPSSIEEDANRENLDDSIVTCSTWMGFGYGIASPSASAFPDYETSAFDDLQPSFAFPDIFPSL